MQKQKWHASAMTPVLQTLSHCDKRTSHSNKIKHVLQFVNRENYVDTKQGPKYVTISPEAVDLLTVFSFWILFLHVNSVLVKSKACIPPYWKRKLHSKFEI